MAEEDSNLELSELDDDKTEQPAESGQESEASRQEGRPTPAGFPLGQFRRGEDTLRQAAPPALEDLANARGLHQVGADGQHAHRRASRSRRTMLVTASARPEKTARATMP